MLKTCKLHVRIRKQALAVKICELLQVDEKEFIKATSADLIVWHDCAPET